MSSYWDNATRRGAQAYIIAEIGKNQIQTEEDRPVREYLENAKELMTLAYESGADCVKFQTHQVHDEQLNIEATSPHFKGADRYSWVTRNTLATPFDKFWVPLKKYADELGVSFISTPMSRGAAQLLEKLGVPFWKIGSGDMLDFVTLDYIASTGKPVIISSGMSTLDETKIAVKFLRDRNVDLALLHCVSQYPCPPEELNLNTICFFKELFPELTIGFSDHSLGYESSVAAVSLGAQIIEKHFSLSRDLWGADHKVSLTPEEFKNLVEHIKRVERDPALQKEWLEHDLVTKGLGHKEKILGDKEKVFRDYFRKTLVAACAIKAGTSLTADMVYAMRPQAFAKGLPSEAFERVIGQRVVHDMKQYDAITDEAIGS